MDTLDWTHMLTLTQTVDWTQALYNSRSKHSSGVKCICVCEHLVSECETMLNYSDCFTVMFRVLAGNGRGWGIRVRVVGGKEWVV